MNTSRRDLAVVLSAAGIDLGSYVSRHRPGPTTAGSGLVRNWLGEAGGQVRPATACGTKCLIRLQSRWVASNVTSPSMPRAKLRTSSTSAGRGTHQYPSRQAGGDDQRPKPERRRGGHVLLRSKMQAQARRSACSVALALDDVRSCPTTSVSNGVRFGWRAERQPTTESAQAPAITLSGCRKNVNKMDLHPFRCRVIFVLL
jgi:hypothetical protein